MRLLRKNVAEIRRMIACLLFLVPTSMPPQ